VPWLLAATLALAEGVSGIQAPDSIPAPRSVPATVPSSPAEGAYPEAEATLLLEEAGRLLAADMPVTASRALARDLSSGRLAGPEAIILAARAYASHRTWPAVRRLLVDQPWLGEFEQGAGQRLLARAYLGLESFTAAAETYQAYLEAGRRAARASSG
jgi:hypothetical protein